jgi:hypothetical protein
MGLHRPARPPDPPVEGRFTNGHGKFLGNDMLGGQLVTVRLLCKDITATSARFEQAFSYDDGQSWHTNWIITLRAHE